MKFKKIVRETSDLDDMDYEIAQKMQDFAKENIPEVSHVVSGSVTGQLYVMLNPDVYIMADEAKEIARELIRASGARGYRYVGVNKADPYIVIARRGVAMEGSEMHPEITCDRCGFTSRQEDYFDIEGDEILCDQCRRGITIEAMKKSRMHSSDAEKGWFGIKDAKFIYHGDWNDPEVEYKGVSLNYWDVESGLLEIYRDEHPEDRNDKGFDKWMAAHPEEIKNELELLYDAEMEYRAENPKGQYNEVEYKPSPEYDDSWTWGGKRHEWGDTYGTLCSKYGPMVSLEQKHYIQKLVKEIADEFDVKTYDGFNNLVCVSTNGVSDEDAEDFIQEILDNYPELDYVETGKHWFKFALKEDDFIDHLVDDDDNTYKDIDYSGLRKYDESWVGDKAKAGRR